MRDGGEVHRETPFALTARQVFATIAPVMGVLRLADRIAAGAGWPPRWGCRAAWAFGWTLVLCGPCRKCNLQSANRNLTCLTLSVDPWPCPNNAVSQDRTYEPDEAEDCPAHLLQADISLLRVRRNEEVSIAFCSRRTTGSAQALQDW